MKLVNQSDLMGYIENILLLWQQKIAEHLNLWMKCRNFLIGWLEFLQVGQDIHLTTAALVCPQTRLLVWCKFFIRVCFALQLPRWWSTWSRRLTRWPVRLLQLWMSHWLEGASRCVAASLQHSAQSLVMSLFIVMIRNYMNVAIWREESFDGQIDRWIDLLIDPKFVNYTVAAQKSTKTKTVQ